MVVGEIEKPIAACPRNADSIELVIEAAARGLLLQRQRFIEVTALIEAKATIRSSTLSILTLPAVI